jgi:LysR family transcriptional regulator, flagellar master operon regulator
MQIELLDTFLDLAETRSFHRTAERLRVTQSSVSARVAALEEAVGSRLFDRSRAGTDLTPEGRRFAPHARALRHEWNEARRRIRIPQGADQLLRLGIQNDLAAVYLGDWMAGFRNALPQTAFYIEPDYSNQMCADLLTGILDLAVMFSPKPHPDLHFESVGEVTYRMISTDTEKLSEVRPDRFVFAHFSPAFEEMHRQLTPELATSSVSVGQSGGVVSLILAMGGSGYVLDKTAAELVASGRCRAVADAPDLRQPVFATIHIRHRTQALHRRLIQLVARHFG